MAYRLDIPDGIVDQSIDLLKEVVGEINETLGARKVERNEPQDDGDHVDRVK
jgi:hypothetical protein